MLCIAPCVRCYNSYTIYAEAYNWERGRHCGWRESACWKKPPILPHCCNRTKLVFPQSPTSISSCNLWLLDLLLISLHTRAKCSTKSDVLDPLQVLPNSQAPLISTGLQQLFVLAEAKGNQSGDLKIKGQLYNVVTKSWSHTNMHEGTNAAQELLKFKMLRKPQTGSLQTHPTSHHPTKTQCQSTQDYVFEDLLKVQHKRNRGAQSIFVKCRNITVIRWERLRLEGK